MTHIGCVFIFYLRHWVWGARCLSGGLCFGLQWVLQRSQREFIELNYSRWKLYILWNNCYVPMEKSVNNQLNDDWITFTCFGFIVLVLCMLAHSHTLMAIPEHGRAIVNVISDTCDFSYCDTMPWKLVYFDWKNTTSFLRCWTSIIFNMIMGTWETVHV